MRYLFLTLAMSLPGCATKNDLLALKTEVTAVRRTSDTNRYHLQVESCRTNVLLCAINASQSKSGKEEECIQSFAACVSSALDEYRDRYGSDPSDLFDPKRAR